MGLVVDTNWRAVGTHAYDQLVSQVSPWILQLKVPTVTKVSIAFNSIATKAVDTLVCAMHLHNPTSSFGGDGASISQYERVFSRWVNLHARSDCAPRKRNTMVHCAP